MSGGEKCSECRVGRICRYVGCENILMQCHAIEHIRLSHTLHIPAGFLFGACAAAACVVVEVAGVGRVAVAGGA